MDWLKENEEEKLVFLNNLGVHTEQSDFIRFKNYFLDKAELEEEFEVSIFSDSQLVNTLGFLRDKQIEIKEEDKLWMLQNVYSALNYENYVGQIPMIYVQQFEDADNLTYKIANKPENLPHSFPP